MKKVKAIRGAIQLENDSEDSIVQAVSELYNSIIVANRLKENHIISLIISQTRDLRSYNPAAALRKSGVKSFPLFCLQELETEKMMPRVIRFLLHVYMPASKEQKHIYKNGAEKLRPDIS